jgi:uncharacterized protein
MTTAAATGAGRWRLPGWRAFALGAAAGVVLALVETAILLLLLHESPPHGGRPDGAGIRAFVAFLIVVVPLEEWLFRGVVLQRLLKPVGPIAALLVSSALFALAHRWMSPPYLQFLNHFVGGVILGVFYLWTRSLWPSIALHYAHNATWFTAMYLLTPPAGS